MDEPAQTHRPRILFLTQVLPYPLDAGPKVRAYHMLRALAEHNDVHLLSFVRDDDTREAIAHLEGVCASVEVVPIHRSRLRDVIHLARAVARGRSFIIERDNVPAINDAVRHACARHDFGCGFRLSLARARAIGRDVAGIDSLPEHGTYARGALQLDVISDTLLLDSLAPANYEVITAFHVLEHLPEPRAELRFLRRLLKPGGIIAIEMPNIARPLVRLLRTSQPPLRRRPSLVFRPADA